MWWKKKSADVLFSTASRGELQSGTREREECGAAPLWGCIRAAACPLHSVYIQGPEATVHRETGNAERYFNLRSEALPHGTFPKRLWEAKIDRS